MKSLTLLRTIIGSFPEVTEQPHFEKLSFRIRKKIFATYDETKNQATVKLNAIDQDVFSSGSAGSIYPVPNKWGKQGWTIIELEKVNRDLLEDALKTAYVTVGSKDRKE